MIVLTGPTGVGKTDCALALAQFIPIEIINADVGQLYTPLTIGTAKPDWKNQQVMHHLFDVIDEPRQFSVVEFLRALRELVPAIKQRGNIPLVVGGSSFYVNALFFPPHPSSSVAHRTYEHDTAQLWQHLFTVDPERARAINKNDRYRLERALDLWHAHGQKPSRLQPIFDPLVKPAAFIVIDRERSELYERINKRVELMIAAGWVREVQALSPAWHEFLLKKKLIGYDDIVRFIRGETSDEQALITEIAHKTRQYAKRQMTFNRLITKRVEEHRDCVYTGLVSVSGDTYASVARTLYETLKEQKYVR